MSIVKSQHDYVAIIDIGSNAVRLVVYDGFNRAPVKIHNERNLCRLGDGLAQTGKLNPDGVTKALSSIRRFSGLLSALKIKNVRAVATAAVRDAEDGKQFIARVKKEFGITVTVIDGDDEARLSATGVLMNGLGSNGVIGDYGGGSLELIVVENGKVKQKASLPIGSHRLHAEPTRQKRIEKIDAYLDTVPFLKKCKGRDFYALGGAWRSMGRAHMAVSKHPLMVLDQYAVDGKKAFVFADKMARQSSAALQKTAGLSKKRVQDMGVAALVMERLFARIAPKRLVFSATGLREGLLFDRLPSAVQKQDSLIASCNKVARKISRFDDIGSFRALSSWMAPLFAKEGADFKRYLDAASLLSDTGWFEHEDYQAAHAFERMLVLPLYGIDHKGRVFLALSQYVRYEGVFFVRAEDKLPDAVDKIVRAILTPHDIHNAVMIGLLLRIGYLLTGGALRLLSQCKLSVTPKKVLLSLKGSTDELNADVIGDTLQEFADLLGRKAEVKSL